MIVLQIWAFDNTVNSVQSEFPSPEEFLTVFCGNGCGVIQPNSFPDTEQGIKVTDFPGSKGYLL
jgi:hypothetical protein